MKSGVWLGALVLYGAGQTAELAAQQTAWRPARRPPSVVALSSEDLHPCPWVTLGRPVPLSPWHTSPGLSPTGVVPVGYQVREREPAAAGNSSMVVASTLPTWSEVEDDGAGTFAVERSQASGQLGAGSVPGGAALIPAGSAGQGPAPGLLTVGTPGDGTPWPTDPGTAPLPPKDWAGGPTPGS